MSMGTTKSNRRPASLTEYEVIGSPGLSADTTPPVATEYESPSGLDLNNPEPGTESSNAEAELGTLAVGGETVASELGEVGGLAVDEADAVALPDAIVGSYPEIAESVLEVIIGADERIRVTNTRVFPWRAVCALRITAANNRQFIGTGWLISPRTVITAGHCVYMHEEGGWARSIQVIPGCNDADQPYGVHVGTTLRSVTGWTTSKKREFDYGAIILPAGSRPGDQTGYFGFGTRTDAFLMGAALNLSGYPGDKGGRQQWFMAQRPKAVSNEVITYDIDSMGGQSGSPVWVLENGQRYGVGVHTNGASSGNSATRINSSVYNMLVNWKNLGL
jgi:glutamyl endopeptidase